MCTLTHKYTPIVDMLANGMDILYIPFASNSRELLANCYHLSDLLANRVYNLYTLFASHSLR